MGSSQSSIVRNSVKSLQENITNMINTQSQTTNAQQSSANVLKVNFKGAKIKGCSINLAQTIQADQKIKALSTFNSKTSLESMMNNAIDNTVKQNNESVSGFLSSSFSAQNSSSQTSLDLQNIVRNNIDMRNMQSVIAMADNLNKNELNFEGAELDCTNMPPGYAINSPQDIVVAQYVESVTGLITDALLKNEQIAKTVNKLEQTQKTETKGVAEAISALFSGWGIIMGIAAIVIIGVVYTMFVKAKPENIKAFGDVAGNIASTMNPAAAAAKGLGGLGGTKFSFYRDFFSSRSSFHEQVSLGCLLISTILLILVCLHYRKERFAPVVYQPTPPKVLDPKNLF